jgi:predicted transcriptional regulator
MPLSVRLDKKTESLLQETASTLKTSKAEVVKQSLSDYCVRVLTERRKQPYDLIRDLLDRRGSGKGDLSERGEEILRERFRRKK